MSGPLSGARVIELAGLGPAPFAAMLLADLGAEVIQIERVAGFGAKLAGGPISDLVNRRRRSIRVDLKSDPGREIVVDLVATADVFLEAFRPGTTERLGLGPTELLARNPKLIYGRMTGWGQSGPLSNRAGHDLNYLAITGALYAMGHADQPPPPPLNLVADYGGGAMFLVVGVLAALFAVKNGTGEGQVIDAAMVDGVVALTTLFHSLAGSGAWTDQRRANLLDGGLPCYATYECRGGGYLSLHSNRSSIRRSST
jgi:alpha-methylacyl-CoA racemase